jgi:Recombination directionality factor-like
LKGVLHMIVGITHDPNGRVIQRLSVSTKVAIGLPPNGDNNHPTKLDHFVFLKKEKGEEGVEWEPDPELIAHYGNECRSFHVVLIDDDIENVFPTSYAWWTATERRCWGDGNSAIRRTKEQPGGRKWTPCGVGCPELGSGLCKPTGSLHFVLADFPRLGSVCRIHTTSYRSIRQIHSALEEIHTFTAGRLAGLTAKLVVRSEETTYFDPKEKRKRFTTIWALSLEVEGEDMRKLVSNLTANARVFAESRKLLGHEVVLKVAEEEREQAQELASEFYGDDDASRTVTSGKSDEVSAINPIGEPQPKLREANPSAENQKTVKPAIREPQRKPLGPTEPNSAPALSATPGRATKSPEANNGEHTTIQGVVGALEPDASGKTMRKANGGTDYVVFSIRRNGDSTKIYCNKPRLIPEISWLEGQEAVAEVAIVSENGRQYHMLNGLREVKR